MSATPNRPVLNLDQLEWREWGKGERYQARIAAVGQRLGARKLGYNVTVLPPGKAAFPAHAHRTNEEMFFVLEGEGEIRIGNERHALRAGDFVACPPCGPDQAHQVRNTSRSGELRYIALSTRLAPDVVDYPDSGKVGFFAELPNASGTGEIQRFMTRLGDTQVDYWDGEA